MLQRPCAPSRNDFFAIYVLLSRTRHGSNFRAIANADDLDFLRGLKPSNELIAFIYAYYDDNGRWTYTTINSTFKEGRWKIFGI